MPGLHRERTWCRTRETRRAESFVYSLRLGGGQPSAEELTLIVSHFNVISFGFSARASLDTTVCAQPATPTRWTVNGMQTAHFVLRSPELRPLSPVGNDSQFEARANLLSIVDCHWRNHIQRFGPQCSY
jgi:hypothetical protein